MNEDENNRCAICGRRQYKNEPLTIEHIFPKFLYFCCDSTKKEEMREFIFGDANLCKTHKACNESKGAKIYTIRNIHNLHISDGRKNELIEFIYKFDDEIRAYHRLLSDTLQHQHGKCYVCGCSLSMKTGVLRKRYRAKGNASESYVALCKGCRGKSYSKIRKSVYYGDCFENQQGILNLFRRK